MSERFYSLRNAVTAIYLPVLLAALGTPTFPNLCKMPYLESCCRGEELYDPQPGDLYFGWSGGMPQKAAYRLVLAGPPSHVGMFVRMPGGEMMVLEATTDEPDYGDKPGVFLRPALWRLQTYQGPVWIRKLRCPLTPEESADLTQFALCQVGKPFARWRSILISPFARPTKGPLCAAITGPASLNRDKWFCSELLMAASVVIHRADRCRIKPTGTTPRDMFLDRQLDLSCHWEKPASVCWK
jgi:hypothetical protein